jgi:hypothetical protein
VREIRGTGTSIPENANHNRFSKWDMAGVPYARNPFLGRGRKEKRDSVEIRERRTGESRAYFSSEATIRWERMRGSIQSRKASPRRLNARTAKTTARAGKRTR